MEIFDVEAKDLKLGDILGEGLEICVTGVSDNNVLVYCGRTLLDPERIRFEYRPDEIVRVLRDPNRAPRRTRQIRR